MARNFGLRHRNAGKALQNAYALSSNGYASNATVKTALKHFNKHIKEVGIKDLRKVERHHVQSFAENMAGRYERGEISISTAQNYIASVNVAMSNARLDKKCHVNAVRDIGLPQRTGIATVDKTITESTLTEIKSQLSNRLSAQLDLQKTLGLRCKESSLIDAGKCLSKAIKTGKIHIENGTKGGRLRVIEVTSQKQIYALENAANIQGQARSMIPSNMSWSEYQTAIYHTLEKQPLRCHELRHNYAYERYQQLTNALCPVQAHVPHNAHHAYLSEKLKISLQQAKELDQKARIQISNELGHSRLSITNNYLG